MMKAVVLAYHELGAAALRAIRSSGIEVVALLTHRDDPAEGQWFTSVAREASAAGIPVFAPEDPNHPLWLERLSEFNADLLLCCHYRAMVSPQLRGLFPQGCLNLHTSLLPKFRGRAPINWVLVKGETVTGVTLHHMSDAADAGDIVAQRRVEIGANDDARALTGKLAAAAEALLKETLPAVIAGKASRTAQDEAAATTMPRRRPEDGRIEWHKSAEAIRNLVRAVAHPWPGAFTHVGDRQVFVWKARVVEGAAQAGEVLSVDPLVVACGTEALEILEGQTADGVWSTGAQLAAELNLVPGMRLVRRTSTRAKPRTSVLVLGVNGFIGSHLCERLLADGQHEVYGLDLKSDNLGLIAAHPDFHFVEGDISINREWIEYHIRKCDVLLPLVAIATPIEYVRNPLRVFELDFEENLRVIRDCVKYGKRLVFPSTSEVYGMSTDANFDEDTSNLVTGPINRQRWIYSTSKQLLDRVIWAYGAQRGLRFSLFRPFNWIGPRLDSLDSARVGSSRAITQLILNLVEGAPILLVDGGEQKRCFTDVDEGIDCLYRIIRNEGERCDGQILNIGNPVNEHSIRELAEMLVAAFDAHPMRSQFPPFAGYRVIESRRYYGKGYEDVQHRRPSIRNARRLVNWTPIIPTHTSVERTLDWFLRQYAASHGMPVPQATAAAAR